MSYASFLGNAEALSQFKKKKRYTERFINKQKLEKKENKMKTAARIRNRLRIQVENQIQDNGGASEKGQTNPFRPGVLSMLISTHFGVHSL